MCVGIMTGLLQSEPLRRFCKLLKWFIDFVAGFVDFTMGVIILGRGEIERTIGLIDVLEPCLAPTVCVV